MEYSFVESFISQSVVKIPKVNHTNHSYAIEALPNVTDVRMGMLRYKNDRRDAYEAFGYYLWKMLHNQKKKHFKVLK